jgi:hypothetical protein
MVLSSNSQNTEISVRLDFHCWMESEQSVIIWFLLKQNKKADDIHRKILAQFPNDAHSIRSVDTGVNSFGMGEKTSMTIRGRVASRST